MLDHVHHSDSLCWYINTETHSVDGGEWGTESEVNTLPHSRQTAGSADDGGGVGTLEVSGGTSKSVWPREKPCGLSVADDISCRNSEAEGCEKSDGEINLHMKY